MAEPAWWDRVKEVFNRERVPLPVWLSIAFEESTLNPFAHNTGTPQHPEDSVGLFQLNRKGGQGSGYSLSYLQDPVNNAMIGAKSIVAAIGECGPTNIECIAVHSGHPGMVPTSDARVQRIARTYRAIGNKSSSDALAMLTGGHLPDIPNNTGGDPVMPGDPPAPGWFPTLPTPSELGSGAVTGAWERIKTLVAGRWTGPRDVVIAANAPWVMAACGLSLISWGVVLAAIKSTPGRAVASAASAVPIPQVQAGAGVARVIQGEDAPSAIVTPIVRARAPRRVTKRRRAVRVTAG